jgi:hypothetical protein
MIVLLALHEELLIEVEVCASRIYRLSKVGLTHVKNRYGPLSRLCSGDLRCIAARLLSELKQEGLHANCVAPAKQKLHPARLSHQNARPKPANPKISAQRSSAVRNRRRKKADPHQTRLASATSEQPKGQKDQACVNKSNENKLSCGEQVRARLRLEGF